MSKLGLIYAPKARMDVNAILVFSARQWGRQQMLAYADEIRKAAELLRDYPESGHVDESLPEDLRLYRFGSHTIVYTVRGDDLYVARILHQNMSLPENL